MEDGFSQIFQHLDAAIAGGSLHGYEALYALHVVLQAQLNLIAEVHKRIPSTERRWEVLGEGNGKNKRKGNVVRQKARARNMRKARARASPSASPRGVGSLRKGRGKSRGKSKGKSKGQSKGDVSMQKARAKPKRKSKGKAKSKGDVSMQKARARARKGKDERATARGTPKPSEMSPCKGTGVIDRCSDAARRV